MNQSIKIAALAGITIVFITFVVLIFDASITGRYTYSGGFKQYSPSEACRMNGCVWDLEVQRGLAIASPFHTPMVGCVCKDNQFIYVPLIERVM